MVTAPGQRGPRHLVVEAPDGTSTADLHERLGLDGPPVGQRLPLHHGYAVDAPGRQPPRPAAVRLVVAAGPDAGTVGSLVPGRWLVLGRAASCDLTIADGALSREHLRVRHERCGVVVQDLGSTNGLQWELAGPPDGAAQGTVSADPTGRGPGGRHGGEAVAWPPGAALRVGASRLVLVLGPPAPAAGREGSGRLVVTSWPRALPDRETSRFSTPRAPERREVRAPSAWTWGLPLVASVVAAVVLRMPLVLVFGLMAPAMVLGHHLGERRSSRADHRAALRRHAERLEELAADAAQAAADDLALLRERHPGVLGAVTSLLPWPTSSLWSRAGESPVVVLGEGRTPSRVEVDGAAVPHDDAPVVLALSGPVTVIGPADLRAALVRGWVLQLACGHPPSELSLVVDPAAPPTTEWDLLAWLPHTRPATGPRTPLRIAWARPDGLLLVDEPEDAPTGAVQVLLQDATRAVLRRPGQEDVPFRPTLVRLPLVRSLARTLAGVDHHDPDGVDRAGRPVALGDLLPWPTSTDQVRRCWSAGRPRLDVPIGVGDAGDPLVVDLARDGPHALVAGTTGSGKSELLRTLVTALALRNAPSALSLLLIDYKGGSSLAECAALPHSAGLVTDLDPHLAERVLVSLRAELRRREAVLARAGARDVRDHDGPDLPRLLVVIDEFRVLAEELPDFLGALVRLAAVGRSLGVHLVLATQRPAGVVSADLRANVNLRIALRVRDAADSLDVLEVPDAAALPEGHPGMGLLRTGSTPPRGVQVAPAAAGRPGPDAAAWQVDEVAGPWAGWARLHTDTTTEEVASGLGGLPDLLARVAEEDGLRPLRVWQPPLQDTVAATGLAGAWAVADRPDMQRHEPVTWDAARHVAIVGAARSGRTTAARSLLAAAGPAWLYVVDPARGLEGTELSRHPGLRAWVGPQDPAHALRVLEVVNEVLDARSARGADRGRGPVVLLVDGWDRFVAAYGEVAQGRARELALRVLRDGPGAGVVAVLTGDRSLLLGSVSAALPETWALRLHDPGDLALAGLHPRQVPSSQPPGRAVRTHDGMVAQVLLPGDETPPSVAVAGPPPPRVVSLPADLGVGTATGGWAVGGDEAVEVQLLPAPFLVLGPPGSGVTTTLGSVSRHLGDVVQVGAGALTDVDALRSRLTGFTGTVVVDDAHLLAGSQAEEVVLAWAGLNGGRIVVGAELEAGGSLFRGLVPQVARHRRGVVLQPGTPAHGALLGVRLPVGDRPLPGRGVLVDRGRCTRVQVRPVSPPGRA